MRAIWGGRGETGRTKGDIDRSGALGGVVDAIGWCGGAIERDGGPNGTIVPSGGETGKGETPFVGREGAFVSEGARSGGDVALRGVAI